FTVAQAVDLFARACAARAGTALVVEKDEAITPFEQPSLRLDPEKAHHRLGWRPLLDFATTVEWSATWYWQHHCDPAFDARAATLAQIDAYERLAADAGTWWAATDGAGR